TLKNGKRLGGKGRYHVVLRPTRKRGYVWGSDELVGALRRAARRVGKAYPGSVLQVANMSKEGGGDIVPSVSHNSGRDADLSFYIMNKRGKAIMRDGFTRFDAKGRSGDIRFDAARNWALVKALLKDKKIQVQWMFCSNSLRRILLDHAASAGERRWLIDRASQVLGQPGNSSPHAEHFHVRLYCALHERLEGCRNYGTMHEWVDTYANEVAARAKLHAESLTDPDTAVAVAAARAIGEIRGEAAIDALGVALNDPRPDVRTAAVEVIALLSNRVEAVPALLDSLQKSTSADWTHRVCETVAAIGDVRAAPAFAILLADSEVRATTRALAAAGLGQMLHVSAIPTLIHALTDKAKTVRKASEGALLRLTNHGFGNGRRAVKRWRTWWKANARTSRMDWVAAGFASEGITPEEKRRLRDFKKLLKHIKKGGQRGFNARALIAHLTGYSIAQGHFTDFQMFRFYRSWLKRGGWRKKPATPN
ncbi:MAG: hypothetical protein ACI9OJ_005588, partial [Myxococcota bacterium]